MKAAVLYGKGDIRCDEVPVPIPKEGEVLIQVKAAGICGSDIPRVLGDAAHYYPIILGHEFSGRIEAVGPGVKGVRIGQKATAAPLLPCMACADCMQGNYSLCSHYQFIGSSVQGAFAQFVKVPARNVVTFDDSVPYDTAAFFEPSTVALHGIRQALYHGGEDVAILGGGTVGLFTMQCAKLLGAKRVTVFDINPVRLELAKRLGADEAVDTAAADYSAAAVVDALTDGKGFGFVFETAGQNATMRDAFSLVAKKGTCCFIGTSSRDLQFAWKLFEQLNRKEFRLTGSWMSYSAPFPGREWTDTAYYMGTGQLKFDNSLIFQKFPLSEAAAAFELFKTPRNVNGKVLLVNEEE